jgi:hypothetical protein
MRRFLLPPPPQDVTVRAALTNKTGGALVLGDVVVLDTANNSAVALDDTQWSLRTFAVAQGPIANNALGPFLLSGSTTVKVTGTVTRGDYLRKSATTKTAEDLGLSLTTTAGRPYGSLGVALTADAAGVATVLWWGTPPGTGTVAVSLGETTTATGAQVDLITFSNLNIPKTAHIAIRFNLRKTGGAASAPTLGLKVNGSQIINNFAVFSAANQVEYGATDAGHQAVVMSHDATYLRMSGIIATTASGGYTGTSYSSLGGAADLPNAAITSLTLTASSVSALVTMAVKDVIVKVESP